MKCSIPVSIGELADRISILKIKSERVTEEKKLENIQMELSLLNEIPVNYPGNLFENLYQINLELWKVEDELRFCERWKTFGNRFIELARSVYKLNDRRAELKKQINNICDSEIIEEKQYTEY